MSPHIMTSFRSNVSNLSLNFYGCVGVMLKHWGWFFFTDGRFFFLISSENKNHPLFVIICVNIESRMMSIVGKISGLEATCLAPEPVGYLNPAKS